MLKTRAGSKGRSTPWRSRWTSGTAAGTIAVIACAVGGSVTVLPAVLQLLGPRIDAGRIPFLPHRRSPGESRRWPAVTGAVLRRPLVAATISAAFLLALAYPALSLHLAKPSDLALTARSGPALTALAEVRQAFPAGRRGAARRHRYPRRATALLDEAARPPQLVPARLAAPTSPGTRLEAGQQRATAGQRGARGGAPLSRSEVRAAGPGAGGRKGRGPQCWAWSSLAAAH